LGTNAKKKNKNTENIKKHPSKFFYPWESLGNPRKITKNSFTHSLKNLIKIELPCHPAK